MIANCPNLAGGFKTVAFGKGAISGGGCNVMMPNSGMAGCGGGKFMAGCCKVGGGALLGHGLLPLALIAAVGILGYKVYSNSQQKNEKK